MAITSGFFDSVNGDRMYDAEQMSNYFDGLVSDGVYENVGERFLVNGNSGMTINVGSGRAIIKCRWIKNDATTTLTLDPSDVQLNRIDAVVLRLDTTARSIDLVIKKGTAVSGTPTMPAITRTETVYELYLASVYIARGATQPTSITDLRPSSYCGWVTGVIQQVDTSDLFLQWQEAYEQQFARFDAFIQQKEAAFNEWFATLTQELRVDVSITKYQEVVTLEEGYHTWVPIPIGQYNHDTDVLFVYVNGVYFTEYYDYSVQTTSDGYRIHVNKALKFGDEVTFIVLKNVIGKNVISGNLSSARVVLQNPNTAGRFVTFGEVE